MLQICFWKWILKTDPCPYLIKYLPDALKKKTKVLDIFNMDKKCTIKTSGDMDKDPFSWNKWICIIIKGFFTIEYVVRLFASPRKYKFMKVSSVLSHFHILQKIDPCIDPCTTPFCLFLRILWDSKKIQIYNGKFLYSLLTHSSIVPSSLQKDWHLHWHLHWHLNYTIMNHTMNAVRLQENTNLWK